MNNETLGRIQAYLERLPAVQTYGFQITKITMQETIIPTLEIMVGYQEKTTVVRVPASVIAKFERAHHGIEFTRALWNVPNVAMRQINIGV